MKLLHRHLLLGLTIVLLAVITDYADGLVVRRLLSTEEKPASGSETPYSSSGASGATDSSSGATESGSGASGATESCSGASGATDSIPGSTDSGSGTTESSSGTNDSESSSSAYTSDSTTTEPAGVTTEKELDKKQILKEIQEKLGTIKSQLQTLKELFSTATTTTGAPTAGSQTTEDATTVSGAPTTDGATTGPSTSTEIPTKTAEFLKDEGTSGICNDDDNTACKELEAAMDSVEIFTGSFDPTGDVSESDLSNITQTTNELDTAVEKVKDDTSGVNASALNTRITRVEQSISEAETKIEEEIQNLEGGSGTDNTVAIVLGTLGGVLAVGIIVAVIIRYKKKKKKKKKMKTSKNETNETA